VSYCSVTTFTESAYLVLVTLFSQLFLAVRVYAVRERSKMSFSILVSMAMTQLLYGVVYVIIFKQNAYTYAALASPQTYTFATCLQGPHDTGLQLGYLGLSLGFDITAFLMIAIYSYNSTWHTFNDSGLLSRVVQDATVYFLVIVWAHLTVTIYTSRMGDSRILRLFPTITNIVIPVMVCRLVLSLRKASDPNAVKTWNVDHFSNRIGTGFHQEQDGVPLAPMRFHPPTVTNSERGVRPGRSGPVIQVVGGPPPDSGSGSRRWTIDGPEDEERPRRERNFRAS